MHFLWEKETPLGWEVGEGEVSQGDVTEKALDVLDEAPVCFQTAPEDLFPPWGRMNFTSPLPGRCLATAPTLILPIKRELFGIIEASLVTLLWLAPHGLAQNLLPKSKSLQCP